MGHDYYESGQVKYDCYMRFHKFPIERSFYEIHQIKVLITFSSVKMQHKQRIFDFDLTLNPIAKHDTSNLRSI